MCLLLKYTMCKRECLKRSHVYLCDKALESSCCINWRLQYQLGNVCVTKTYWLFGKTWHLKSSPRHSRLTQYGQAAAKPKPSATRCIPISLWSRYSFYLSLSLFLWLFTHEVLVRSSLKVLWVRLVVTAGNPAFDFGLRGGTWRKDGWRWGLKCLILTLAQMNNIQSLC